MLNYLENDDSPKTCSSPNGSLNKLERVYAIKAFVPFTRSSNLVSISVDNYKSTPISATIAHCSTLLHLTNIYLVIKNKIYQMAAHSAVNGELEENGRNLTSLLYLPMQLFSAISD